MYWVNYWEGVLMTHAKKAFVRGAAILGLAFVLSSLFPGQGRTQVAVSTTIVVSQEETKLVASGWSAKKNILGKAFYNDSNQKIGTVDDLIIAPDRSVSFAIIGVGGCLGIAKHDVAIPIKNLKEEQNKLILPGATKEALKALPEFQYAKADN